MNYAEYYRPPRARSQRPDNSFRPYYTQRYPNMAGLYQPIGYDQYGQLAKPPMYPMQSGYYQAGGGGPAQVRGAGYQGAYPTGPQPNYGLPGVRRMDGGAVPPMPNYGVRRLPNYGVRRWDGQQVVNPWNQYVTNY